MGPRAGLHAEARGETPVPLSGIEPRIHIIIGNINLFIDICMLCLRGEPGVVWHISIFSHDS